MNNTDHSTQSKKTAENAEKSDIKWLMSSKNGRRVAWRILEQTGVFRSSFSPTAMVMSFNEGNRNQGSRLLDSILQHCPEQFPPMMKENANVKLT